MKCVEVFVLCVVCMRTRPGMCLRLLLDMQGRGSFYDGVRLVALCRSVLLCEVFSLSCVLFFLRVFVFWRLVMSSPVDARFLIGRSDLYLILSFQIRYRLGWSLSVCLMFVVVFFFSSFLFI